jgi:hypothetical protein
MKPVIYIVSTDALIPEVFSRPLGEGLVEPVRQDRLTDEAIEGAAGLITGLHVDQIDLLGKRGAIARMLDRGGRMAINGHVLRPYVEEFGRFVPLQRPRRADYVLTRLHDRPVFEGISARQLETNRGVAGFYGRGHNPLPEGAVPLTGLGPDLAPVDWVWRRPRGGAVFMHSGHDLWGAGDDPGTTRLIAERLVRWCLGGSHSEDMP